MSKSKLNASEINDKKANVFLNSASGFYDKSAKVGERVTLLEGSILEKPDPKGWIYRDLEILVKQGDVERLEGKYKVLKPITGSTSGTAAAVLGIGFKPAGYKHWKFEDGHSISDAGEK